MKGTPLHYNTMTAPATLQETMNYLFKEFKQTKGCDDDSRYMVKVEMKDIHTTLDEGGLHMIDSLIDIAVGYKRPLEETMVKFSYEPPNINVPCEVKQSDHGRGVFATRDIKKGETVTLYPAHCICIPHKGNYQAVGHCEYDWEYALTHSLTNVIHSGDKEMEDPLFLGHLINDFCSFVGDFKEKGKNQGALMMKYFIHALAFQNVEFYMKGKHFISIKASKDIKEGEELLVAYSPTYWTQLSTKEVMNQTMDYINTFKRSDPKKGLFLADKFAEYYQRKS